MDEKQIKKIVEKSSMGQQQASDFMEILFARKKTSSFFTLRWWDRVLTPFENIRLSRLHWVGVVSLLLLSGLGMAANLYYPAFLDLQIVVRDKPSFGFLNLIGQCMANSLVFSMVSFILCRLMKGINLRFSDFLMVANFSHLPYVGLAFLLLIVESTKLIQLNRAGFSDSITFSIALIGLISILHLIAKLILVFQGLSLASGFKGKKIVFLYVFSIFIAEGVSLGLLSLLFNF
tara:strand:+ start:44074 stop:44772 length:699 start_codon:yes stop_codon:yes gene_type:complete